MNVQQRVDEYLSGPKPRTEEERVWILVKMVNGNLEFFPEVYYERATAHKAAAKMSLRVVDMPICDAVEVMRRAYRKHLTYWRKRRQRDRKRVRQTWLKHKANPNERLAPGAIPEARSLCVDLPNLRRKFRGVQARLLISHQEQTPVVTG